MKLDLSGTAASAVFLLLGLLAVIGLYTVFMTVVSIDEAALTGGAQ